MIVTTLKSATLIVLAASLTIAADASRTPMRGVGRLPTMWAVAFTGLPGWPSALCANLTDCRSSDVATAVNASSCVRPSVATDDHERVYLWCRAIGDPRPGLVVGRDGRIERTFEGGAHPITNVAVTDDGTIYYTGPDDSLVWRVTASGQRVRVAGSYRHRKLCPPKCGDGGPATKASFNGINSIAIDTQGRLLIAETYANSVRRVARNGVVSTIVRGQLYGDRLMRMCSRPCVADPLVWSTLFPVNVEAAADGSVWFEETGPGDAAGRSSCCLWRVAGRSMRRMFYGRMGGFGLDRRTGDAVVIKLDHRLRRPQLVRVSKTGKQTTITQPPSRGCASSLIALTCGDGFTTRTATLSGVPSYATKKIAFDAFGGIYIASQAEEIRYLAPANHPNARLGFAITTRPLVATKGHPIRIAIRSTDTVTITARVQQRKIPAKPAVPIVISSTSTSATWDGRISGRAPLSGRYLVELVATDSQGRVTSRQVPITLHS